MCPQALVVLTTYSGDTPYSLISYKDSVFYLSLHSALLKGFKIKVTELDASTVKANWSTHGIELRR